MNLEGLAVEKPRCQVCGAIMPMAYGRRLWEFWGAEMYPDKTLEQAEQIVGELENTRMCWDCLVNSWAVAMAFNEAQGDLSKTAEMIIEMVEGE